MGWNIVNNTIPYYCIHTLWLYWLNFSDTALDALYVGNRKRLSKKVCQACIEEIHIEATKCKHCGEIQPTGEL